MDRFDCDKRVKQLPGSASGTSYILYAIGEKDITRGYGPRVRSSNLLLRATCGVSSVGRAIALQAMGRRFEPVTPHQGRPKSRAEFAYSV